MAVSPVAGVVSARLPAYVRDTIVSARRVCYSEFTMSRTTSRNGLPKIRKLSRSEGSELLDRHARAELGVSGETFIKRWKAGRYASRANRPEVMRVAMLLPFAR